MTTHEDLGSQAEKIPLVEVTLKRLDLSEVINFYLLTRSPL